MGISVFPAPSAASKTMYRTTLTSGTSYTVPAGVTYLNVTLVGGGGGAGGTTAAGYVGSAGMPGNVVSSTLSATAGASISYAIGAGGAGSAGGNSGNNGATGGTTTFTGATSATGGLGGRANNAAFDGATGSVGFATNGGGQTGQNAAQAGGTGGAGFITVEYWA